MTVRKFKQKYGYSNVQVWIKNIYIFSFDLSIDSCPRSIFLNQTHFFSSKCFFSWNHSRTGLYLILTNKVDRHFCIIECFILTPILKNTFSASKIPNMEFKLIILASVIDFISLRIYLLRRCIIPEEHQI